MRPFSSERIAEALQEIEGVRRVEYLASVGSTNDVAKRLGAEGAPEIAVVVADEQTAGRGRFRRAWWTPPGAALAVSLMLRPSLPLSQAHRLTMLAGLSAAQAIEHVTGLRVGLKWPNDLVVECPGALGFAARQAPHAWRKLGGLLAEAVIAGPCVELAVVGMGINVNVDFSTRADLPDATSVQRELGHAADRLTILRALLERFAARYHTLAQDEHLRGDWAARLITLGRQVVARNGQDPDVAQDAAPATLREAVIEGVAEEVDEWGALLIRTDDGTLRRIDAADVTLRPVAS
jgi:BirA family biotin operon repressor/biotin-[acetyl-CoA-carboxylase] ligase